MSSKRRQASRNVFSLFEGSDSGSELSGIDFDDDNDPLFIPRRENYDDSDTDVDEPGPSKGKSRSSKQNKKGTAEFPISSTSVGRSTSSNEHLEVPQTLGSDIEFSDSDNEEENETLNFFTHASTMLPKILPNDSCQKNQPSLATQ